MNQKYSVAKNLLASAVGLAIMYQLLRTESRKLPYSQYLSGQAYVNLRVRGRIDTIYQYNKGYPVVRIAGQNMQMQLGTTAQKYLAVGDSVVKEPHSLDITTYRTYTNFIEVMRWSSTNPQALIGGFVSRDTLPRR
ncbi:hypothetical protein EJV47_11025 [Hymenobacter gummosus]|uniref:Uncharacterized protein n=1 Tax=Hymenobacter gummosus TaxID=1776032 RepID=A0A431U3H5_9BACT|nr:hypothetical protein [Hymenobacter gummosus]RTQ50160.1 hypothetical protein EJV47_11025 [Hymenobacter gummosus]